jgi:hypothetical protein
MSSARYVNRETGAEVDAFEFRLGIRTPDWLPPS